MFVVERRNVLRARVRSLSAEIAELHYILSSDLGSDDAYAMEYQLLTELESERKALRKEIERINHRLYEG